MTSVKYIPSHERSMHKDTDKSPSDSYFNDDVFEPGANIHVNNITVSKVLLHASISRLNDQVNKQVTDLNAPPTDPAAETLEQGALSKNLSTQNSW